MTLLDLLPAMQHLDEREAVRFHNGSRTWKFSYQQLYSRICGFSHYWINRDFEKAIGFFCGVKTGSSGWWPSGDAWHKGFRLFR
jgi:hypothetical protein